MAFADLLAVGDTAIRALLGRADVTYEPGVGAAVVVSGVFDAAYVRVDAGNPGVSSTGPAVFLALGELPSNPQTDTDATVTVDGVDYTPHEVHPDGLGGVLLLLHRV